MFPFLYNHAQASVRLATVAASLIPLTVSDPAPARERFARRRPIEQAHDATVDRAGRPGGAWAGAWASNAGPAAASGTTAPAPDDLVGLRQDGKPPDRVSPAPAR